METPGHASADELTTLLRAVVHGAVDDSRRRRAEYASDASNYRVVPQVVVIPRDTDDVLATADVARRTGTPLTVRGGGTSIAGNAVGPGIVLDTSRHLHRILALDAQARIARVEPGVVLSDLQAAAGRHGLRFGPDPSTASRATLGGMIGNNACGAHTVAYGRTADNVVALDVLDGTGRRFTAAQGLDPVPGLADLVSRFAPALRPELGRFGRQVSGYALEHLLPEHGEDVAKALTGSEGTVATVLSATVRLVDVPSAQALVVLGYPDMATAADAVVGLLPGQPPAPRDLLAVEGIDARIVDVVRRHRGGAGMPDLPRGGGWLMVEVGGATAAEAGHRAQALIADADALAARTVDDPDEAAALWRIRADGAGLAGRTPGGAQAWPGWEDAAVPPDRLGAYLRGFEDLMASHGVEGLPYGHFADGCVHVRLDFPLDPPADVDAYRSFLTDAAQLVVSHGGSLSGEHGDGRARSELLPLMYSAPVLEAFRAFKGLLDPANLLNPGVLVDPRPVDADLRRPAARSLPAAGGFAYSSDGADFTTAVHRCVGIGKCRADNAAAGGFMCPSFLATADEKDSTRGRARVLQEMARGDLVDGWGAPEVHDVLDLCLSCKACARDCPAAVDMASYKAEVLYRTHRRRLRPASHYALGWLPRWAALAGVAPRTVNRILQAGAVSRVVRAAGGMDARRALPAFATRPFRSPRGRPRADVPAGRGHSGRRPVLLWDDSFTGAFAPQVLTAAAAVLTAAGYDVAVPGRRTCCGLSWISTGQLDGARRRLRRLLDVLGPVAEQGTPIVGLEPSCTAVLRSDLPELLPEDPRSRAVADATRTLAELLTAPPPVGPADWNPPDCHGVRVVSQPHCHQHAVMGYAADRRLLTTAGAEVTALAGCCGLAGNFGMERGHYDVSVAVAETALLPGLRDAPADAVFLADGFSCRTQAQQLAGVEGRHLAELLADRLPVD